MQTGLKYEAPQCLPSSPGGFSCTLLAYSAGGGRSVRRVCTCAVPSMDRVIKPCVSIEHDCSHAGDARDGLPQSPDPPPPGSRRRPARASPNPPILPLSPCAVLHCATRRRREDNGFEGTLDKPNRVVCVFCKNDPLLFEARGLVLSRGQVLRGGVESKGGGPNQTQEGWEEGGGFVFSRGRVS